MLKVKRWNYSSAHSLRRLAAIILVISFTVAMAGWFISPVSDRAIIDYRLISAIVTDSPSEALLALESGGDPGARKYFRGKPWKGLAVLGMSGQFSDSVPLWIEFIWPESGKGNLPRIEKQQLLAVLLEHGANSNETSGGRPILALAVKYGFNAAAMELISHGADPNLCDFTGAPPLVYAVDADNVSAIGLLVQNGADANWADAAGSTLLIRAVQVRSGSCVKKLIGIGLNVNAEDLNGMTAFDYAVAIGSPAVSALLSAGGHAGSHVLRTRGRMKDTIPRPHSRAALRTAPYPEWETIRIFTSQGL